MVVNFTLDDSSLDRKRFAPNNSRLVCSSFDGLLNPLVDVNFLEHHGSRHFAPVGKGKICPATDTENDGFTCDACRCDFCFKQPV